MEEDLNEDDNPELEVIKNEDTDLELELMSIKYNVSDLKENGGCLQIKAILIYIISIIVHNEKIYIIRFETRI
jgi:hypothetical protein